MKEVLIISGKGGAGKTTIASGLCYFLSENDVIVDADVDASDMPILFDPRVIERQDFYSGVVPVIDYELCSNCGTCAGLCKYEAIHLNSGRYTIDEVDCEGCALCSYMCPEKAITLKKNRIGEKFISNTKLNIKMIHAKLGIGEENSGKLITAIRQDGRIVADEQAGEFIIIDGPPGIGCSAISAMSGVDLAIVVFEPTISGIHDAKRAIQLAKHFNINIAGIINKFGLNSKNDEDILNYLGSNNISILGKVSYSFDVLRAHSEKKLLPEFNDYFNYELKIIFDNMKKNTIIKEDKMKIAITSVKESKQGKIDPRFARSDYWYVYDKESGTGYFYNNLENSQMSQGAGTQAAAKLIDMKVDVLITKSVGPKAFEVLKKNGIKMYKGDDNKNVEENLLLYEESELKEINVAGESIRF